MFKLIPDEKKKMLEHEYALRRWAVILCSLIAIITIAMVGIFPTYLLSNMKNTNVHERIDKLQATPLSEEDAALKEWYESINKKLKYLSPNLDKEQPSEFIEATLKDKSPGIQIMNFTYTGDPKITLTLSGVAKDRQALISFQDALNESGRYGEVSLPVSNLAKDKDISFQIKLTPPKKKK